MSSLVNQPTPYPDVNALLHELLGGVREVLGRHFIGAYLFGSLATGDFDEASDIDVAVVTDDEIPADLLAAMQAMHARIAADGSPWATQLEVSYLTRRAARRYERARTLYPHLDRGGGESLRLVEHDEDWVVNLHTLRERGITLAGPAPHALIDPVSPEDLRRALLAILRGWWAPMLDDPARLNGRGYQSYAVLTMCRILYTFEHGAVVSKRFAASWAGEILGGRWAPLIERAAAGRHRPQTGAESDDIDGTLALIRFTLERCEQFRPRTDEGAGP